MRELLRGDIGGYKWRGERVQLGYGLDHFPKSGPFGDSNPGIGVGLGWCPLFGYPAVVGWLNPRGRLTPNPGVGAGGGNSAWYPRCDWV